MSLIDGAKIAVSTCMGVKKGEKVLIITDIEKQKIGEALFQAALEAKAEAMLVTMLTRSRDGEEPPDAIAEMMKEVDVIIAPTKFSLTHTQARRKANRAGARIATMPGITEAMVSHGAMSADFSKIEKKIKRVYRKIKGRKKVKIITDLGTDLEMSLKGRSWITEDTGICHKKGEFTNLPAGEIFIAPVEGMTRGKVVIDGSFLEILSEPVKVTVKDGYATRIIGAKNAVKLLNKGGREGRHISKLGIGMNPNAKIIGNVLEDGKALGTIHVGFGDNFTFGGKIRCGVQAHGIIKKPTLLLDGEVIIEKGEMKV